MLLSFNNNTFFRKSLNDGIGNFLGCFGKGKLNTSKISSWVCMGITEDAVLISSCEICGIEAAAGTPGVGVSIVKPCCGGVFKLPFSILVEIFFLLVDLIFLVLELLELLELIDGIIEILLLLILTRC